MEKPRGRLWLAALVAGWLAFALGELLRWHDPIWRFTAALLATGATLLSAVAFHRLGGGPLLRREAFPLAFAWTAVPWPLPVELVLTQNLLHSVTTITISLLGLAGIPAVQHGNALELAPGMLGIDDACSGIRSLQAALMATLFLGEYFRLIPVKRLWLVLGGALVSFVLNCLRVLALALIFQHGGPAVAMRYHDSAGTVATVLTFLFIGLLALMLRERDAAKSSVHAASQPIPSRGGLLAGAAFGAVPVFAALWFTKITGAATATADHPRWPLHAAALPAGWKVDPVSPRPGEQAGLQFSTWEGYRVQSPAGWNAQVIHLYWNTHSSMPSLAFYHTPALCMPWVGWTQTGPPKKVDVPLPGGSLPCAAYRFVQDTTGVLVLQSLSNGGEADYHILDPAHLENRRRRLLTLWQAPLRQINEELLIYIPAVGSEDDQLRIAAEALRVLRARVE